LTGSKRRLAVLLSGRGSNFEAIADAVAAERIPSAEIVAVVSDSPVAPGLARARQRGLPGHAVDRRLYGTRQAHEQAVLRVLDLSRPDLVCLAGYMRLLSPEFVARWKGRLLNIHPSLLPKFPGLSPQRRALEARETVSGCTVHFVDEGTDSGAVILQKTVPILPSDTPESLSLRILVEEHSAYPEAIARVLEGMSKTA
jgi:phosphoribosylglycinamide formyltransferase-1